MARAVFRCQLCLSIAGTLELTAPAEAPASELRLEGFLWEHNTEQVKGATLRTLHQALIMHDVQQIHTLNPMWVPFYCPQCQRTLLRETLAHYPSLRRGFCRLVR